MKVYDIYRDIQSSKTKSEDMDKLMCAFDMTLSKLKSIDESAYTYMNEYVYTSVYGYHFDSQLLEQALKDMKNDDGTTGGHWTVEETTSVANSRGIKMHGFNIYDWCYVMNMKYSDYCDLYGDDTMQYVRQAHKFLNDIDAPNGKALRYYFAMKCC